LIILAVQRKYAIYSVKNLSKKRNDSTVILLQGEEIAVSQGFNDASKKKLIGILTNELKVLRTKAGITQQELADKIGLSRPTYGLIENKKQAMSWSHFLALTFIFNKNEDTAKILEWTGAYTPELENYLELQSETNRPAEVPIMAGAASRARPEPADKK
jgi:DNA-binding XRE family transcriptional regulator